MQAGRTRELPPEALDALRGELDCVVDAGELERCGLVMDLKRYRWDVLGRVEEVLRVVARLLSLLRPGGRLLLSLCAEADPPEFLEAYLSAFPVTLSALPKPEDGRRVYWCCAPEPVGPAQLDAVLVRELRDECSHRRYADALDAALSAGGEKLAILDVGGGDGHMAEWWAASGHSISLLEVDAENARKAAERLGRERVTLHDGESLWPYADKSFDVCLLLFVLHHIASEEATRRTLAEAARVCRRQVLIMEDQPRSATSQGMCRLAVAVTAEHFRPFKQDPNVFMRNIRPDEAWRSLFAGAGLHLVASHLIPGTLQHPVPHTLYKLRPA